MSESKKSVPKQRKFFRMPANGWWGRLQAYIALIVLIGVSFIGAHVYAENAFAWAAFVLGLLFLVDKIVRRIK